MTIKVVGFFKNGLKSCFSNKIENTYSYLYALGQKSYIQVRCFGLMSNSNKRIGPHNIDIISILVGKGDAYRSKRYNTGTLSSK